MPIRVGFQGRDALSPPSSRYAALSDSPNLTVLFSTPARHAITIAPGEIVEFQLAGGLIVQRDGPWRGTVAVDAAAVISFMGDDGETIVIRSSDIAAPG